MIQYRLSNAGVMELADVLDSKSSGSDTVSVRPRSPAPKKREELAPLSFLVPPINESNRSPNLLANLCKGSDPEFLQGLDAL